MIIYLIGGIIYGIYTISKKINEGQNKAVPQAKPIKPPAANPLEEVLKQLQQKQQEVKPKVQPAVTKPEPIAKKQPEEFLIRETKKASFGSGADDYPTYEQTPVVQKEVREQGLRSMEGRTAFKTIDDIGTAEEDTSPLEFDVRQAFIGSVIFERKYV